MTAPETTTKRDVLATLAEVSGIALVSAGGFVLSVSLGLALAGIGLFCIGFFGLAQS